MASAPRALADNAGVNVALIKYHFGGKDELYIGAIDYLISLIKPRLDVVTEMAVQAKAIAGSDPARQAKLMAQLIDTVLTTFLRTPAIKVAIPFVLRELFVPGPHFERFYDAVPRRLHELMTNLVSWILCLEPESDAAKVRTHAVVGQIIIFHLGRTILLHRLGVDEYSDAVIDEIGTQVTQSVLSSLELPNEF